MPQGPRRPARRRAPDRAHRPQFDLDRCAIDARHVRTLSDDQGATPVGLHDLHLEAVTGVKSLLEFVDDLLCRFL